MSPECQRPLALVGCGILRKEVGAIIARHGWELETHFLSSALHHRLDHLYSHLHQALEAQERASRDTLVLYGACHPLMDALLEQHHTLRTRGQNCIAQLIGYDRFMQELERGAYFLLEEWATTCESMLLASFGPHPDVIREIFHGSHSRLLAIRTPCSGDFTAEAEAAARMLDLPLEWMDADLAHLEAVLAEAWEQSRARRNGWEP